MIMISLFHHGQYVLPLEAYPMCYRILHFGGSNTGNLHTLLFQYLVDGLFANGEHVRVLATKGP